MVRGEQQGCDTAVVRYKGPAMGRNRLLEMLQAQGLEVQLDCREGSVSAAEPILIEVVIATREGADGTAPGRQARDLAEKAVADLRRRPCGRTFEVDVLIVENV